MGFQSSELRKLGDTDVMKSAACGGGAIFGVKLLATALLRFAPKKFSEEDAGQLLVLEWPKLAKTASKLVGEGLLLDIPAPLRRASNVGHQVVLAGLPGILGDLLCEFRKILNQLAHINDAPDRGVCRVTEKTKRRVTAKRKRDQ